MSHRFVFAAALLAFASCAQAQYVWIDANGTRQYADRPPPPGTPPHKILKAPGRSASAPAPEATAEPVKPAAKAAPTLAEQEAAYRERAKQRAEQERKEMQEAQMKRDIAARCEAARDAHAQLASGMRIARVGQDGERSYLNDEERAARMAQMNRVLKDCR